MSMSAPVLADAQAETAEPDLQAPVSRAWPRRSVLGLVMLIATLIRIPGVLWGLPNELHPDEPLITRNAISLVKRHSLSPHAFDRPDHLEILLSSFLYRIYTAIEGVASMPTDYVHHPWRYLAMSRCITVAFSVAAIPIAACIGRRFGTATAVLAALGVAFFPPFVANSSYATPDMPLTCMMLAAILACMRYLERPTWLRLFWACAAVGVGFTIKYPAAIAGAIVGVVVVMVMVRSGDRLRGIRHLLLAPLLFVLAVFAVSHTLITDISKVLFQLGNQRGADHLGAEALGYVGNLSFYATYYASWAGEVLIVATVIGAWYCIRRRAGIAVPLLLGVVYWLGLSQVPAHWDRWGLPMYLSPLLFAAIGVGRVWEWLADWWRAGDVASRLAVGGALALLALGAGQLATGSAAVATEFGGRDERVVATPALAAMGITNKNSIFDSYTLLAPGGQVTIASSVELIDGRVQLVAAPRAHYVITGSLMYDRYFALSRYRDVQVRYEAVRNQLPVVATFAPVPQPQRSLWEPLSIVRSLRFLRGVWDGGHTGPTITVYRYDG